MSKKWHPQAVSVGKPIEMDELCKQIALISTVSSADTKATLEALGLVLGTCMNTGRTVHVEGLETFYYTCISTGKGVDTYQLHQPVGRHRQWRQQRRRRRNRGKSVGITCEEQRERRLPGREKESFSLSEAAAYYIIIS